MSAASSTTPLVIIGCGGFGREVHDVIDAINARQPTWDLLGYLDDQPDPANVILIGSRDSGLLGSTDWLTTAAREVQFAIGVGKGKVRKLIDQRLCPDYQAAILVHPTATLGHGVNLGPGSVICAGVRVTNNVLLGRHVHLNINATVGHDCILDDYVTVNPLAAVSGGVHIGPEATVGTHAAIIQNLSIGSRSVIGAGACVVRHVPEDVTVIGVPAR